MLNCVDRFRFTLDLNIIHVGVVKTFFCAGYLGINWKIVDTICVPSMQRSIYLVKSQEAINFQKSFYPIKQYTAGFREHTKNHTYYKRIYSQYRKKY